MKLASLILSALLCASCSTPSSDSIHEGHLAISQVQHLIYGKVTLDDALQKLGKPNRVIPLKRDLEGMKAVIYNEVGQESERLTLLVDIKTNVVQSATWAVKANESLRQVNEVFAAFPDVKFTSKPVGRVSKDYISVDQIYSDQSTGISFYVDAVHQSVQHISFSPSGQRKLAEKAF